MPDSPSSAGSRRGPESEHGQAPKKKRKQRQTFACSGTYRPGSRQDELMELGFQNVGGSR
ncbi:hypothetical protein EHS25_005834 [Saitozyma podzolica]|uniref:Uncharacterized protein n=1 Tax=Saitozyma podzolica TaxID=1890683 RepID=A0A427XVG3_9TREE|nr:hypothetical protein EHS25_005834 [Saitozyma podzolica]